MQGVPAVRWRVPPGFLYVEALTRTGGVMSERAFENPCHPETLAFAHREFQEALLRAREAGAVVIERCGDAPKLATVRRRFRVADLELLKLSIETEEVEVL